MDRQAVLMLGEEESAYGACTVRTSGAGRTACALSVGADPDAPSLASKGSPDIPNEDALLAVDEGARTLLAVADAHFGHRASHVMLQRLAAAAEPIPASSLELLRRIHGCAAEDLQEDSSRCTLLVAVWDRDRGAGYGVSFGDSSLVVLRPGGVAELVNRHDDKFIGPGSPESLDPRRAQELAFVARPGDLVVGFTDGVDGCHYGSPQTSITGTHLADVFTRHSHDPEAFARALTELALRGVDGHPGGQDNIAVVATA